MNTIATQSLAGNVYERMSRVLDLKLESEADAVRVIGKGLSASAVKRAVIKLQVDEALVAPVTTIRRRFKDNVRFPVDESERVVRFVRIYAQACQLFDDPNAARKWLNTPEDYLENGEPVTPMALAATDAGARLIESHLLRTTHGMF